jgi:hypothetical protein
MKMTSKDMKEHISRTKTPVIWRGQVISDVKDVPSDEAIKAADEQHALEILNRR